MKNLFRCLLESSVYTLVVIVIFYFLPFSKEHFLILNLHPLAIVVAFMALRYGIYLGFVSALVTTLGYIYVYSALGNDMVLFLLKFQYYKFFLMFLFIAMFLGRFQTNYKTREEDLKREMYNLKSLLESAEKTNSELLNINLSLKNQIIQSKGSILSFQNVKKNLFEKTNIEAVYEDSMNILKQFLDCEKAGIFTLENNILENKVQLSDSFIENEMPITSENAHRFMETFKKGVPLEFPIDLNGKNPVFIAPLFTGKEINGFLEVESLTYSTSKSYNFEVFKIIASEINNALKIIQERNKSKEKKDYEI
ncbi:hypothetical protein EII29_01545 [Leptotrichia sp. OH3620_COT-345]|uniref:hypothetical protein n=1 Tax=Leptotrichia sp. OH3620_COT-345 TaxID=2491048 RepID=UPI000F645B97|nr:hypothetical protein [Leptotrichia sp. OH3620_COT-345]RRD40646.1 hypothetical protein EII29_01545 [Leptotrichia sp. OH3620_COT-345]